MFETYQNNTRFCKYGKECRFGNGCPLHLKEDELQSVQYDYVIAYMPDKPNCFKEKRKK